MTEQIKAALLGLLLVLAFGCGWVIKDWKARAQIAGIKTEYVTVLQQILEKTAAAAGAVRRAEQLASLAIAAADSKFTGELADAKLETQKLRECVRTGTCGVRIKTVYISDSRSAGAADASPGSVGNDSIALDVSVSERVLNLRDAISEDAAKLGYLREYAEQCHQLGAEVISSVGQSSVRFGHHSGVMRRFLPPNK